MKTLRQSTFFPWIIYFALALIWGSSFILMKKALITYSSVELGASRIVITFIFLLPFAFKRFKNVPRKMWIYIGLAGIIGNGIPAFLFAYAQTGIDSSTAGILNSLTPLFTMIAGLLFFGTKTRWYNLTGVFIGLGGALGLMMIAGGKGFQFNFSFGIFIIIATILYAINANLLKKFLHGVDAITITTFAFFIMGIPATAFLLLGTYFTHDLINKPDGLQGLMYICILAVVGTALSVIAYNKLIKITTAVFASSVTYLMPVIALMWGVADGELFTWSHLLWILLIIAGVYLVNLKPRIV